MKKNHWHINEFDILRRLPYKAIKCEFFNTCVIKKFKWIGKKKIENSDCSF